MLTCFVVVSQRNPIYELGTGKDEKWTGPNFKTKHFILTSNSNYFFNNVSLLIISSRFPSIQWFGWWVNMNRARWWQLGHPKMTNVGPSCYEMRREVANGDDQLVSFWKKTSLSWFSPNIIKLQLGLVLGIQTIISLYCRAF